MTQEDIERPQRKQKDRRRWRGLGCSVHDAKRQCMKRVEVEPKQEDTCAWSDPDGSSCSSLEMLDTQTKEGSRHDSGHDEWTRIMKN